MKNSFRRWMFRQTRWIPFMIPCTCEDLADRDYCKRHGTLPIGSHMVLNRFDGHEHEETYIQPTFDTLMDENLIKSLERLGIYSKRAK